MRRLLLVLALASVAPVLPGTTCCTPAAAAEDDATQAVFQALDEPTRRAVQDALIWTGDYFGSVTGGYGPRTRDAITAYASKHGMTPAALMGTVPRRALLASAQSLRQAVGFTQLRDKKTAFLLSLPTRLLGKETPTATGTRYTSPDSTIVVDTLSRPAGEAGLSDVFTRMSAPQPQRKVTYKLLRDDFFVVSGEVGDRKFYSRYALGTAGEATLVRGFTLTYPQAAASRLDPIALAVAASFDPFPGTGTPMTPPSAGPAVAQAPVAAPPPPPGVDAQAIMVAPGVALTSLTSATCQNPQLDKVAAKFRTEDQQNGLALLDVAGRGGSALNVTPVGKSDDGPVVVIFNGRSGTTFAAPGSAGRPTQGDFTLNAPLQAGSRGAPVFDRTGRLLGLIGATKSPPAIAGILLQADYRVTGVDPILKLLDRAGLTYSSAPADTLTFGDLVATRKAQIATVSCGRS